MESKKIIQNIHSLYDEYCVPDNVRMHMMRVAAVSELICDKMKPKIDSSDLVAVSLIHDLGNIVKMDFDHKRKILLLYKKDRCNLDYLRIKQKEFWKKYGKDDNHANDLIAEEIGVNKRVLYLLKHKGIEDRETNFWVNDIELMILFYADGRVSPKGVTSIKHRLKEYIKRYELDKDPIRVERSKKFLEFSLSVEKIIFKHLKIKPSFITNKSVQKYIKKYKASK